jgi:hypothetical protein
MMTCTAWRSCVRDQERWLCPDAEQRHGWSGVVLRWRLGTRLCGDWEQREGGDLPGTCKWSERLWWRGWRARGASVLRQFLAEVRTVDSNFGVGVDLRLGFRKRREKGERRMLGGLLGARLGGGGWVGRGRHQSGGQDGIVHGQGSAQRLKRALMSGLHSSLRGRGRWRTGLG